MIKSSYDSNKIFFFYKSKIELRGAKMMAPGGSMIIRAQLTL